MIVWRGNEQHSQIEALANQEYKYGFTTDIEADCGAGRV